MTIKQVETPRGTYYFNLDQIAFIDLSGCTTSSCAVRVQFTASSSYYSDSYLNLIFSSKEDGMNWVESNLIPPQASESPSPTPSAAPPSNSGPGDYASIIAGSVIGGAVAAATAIGLTWYGCHHGWCAGNHHTNHEATHVVDY